MPSPFERDPRLYVEDMLAFCERALSYTAGISQSDWQIDDDIVWSIVTDDLPPLRQALTEMLKPWRSN